MRWFRLAPATQAGTGHNRSSLAQATHLIRRALDETLIKKSLLQIDATQMAPEAVNRLKLTNSNGAEKRTFK